MIFGIAEIVAYLSRVMTLWPGDVIAREKPAGAGAGRQPARSLQPGDTVHLGIDGLGEQSQRVAQE